MLLLLFCVECPVSPQGGPVWTGMQSGLGAGPLGGGRVGHMEKTPLLRLEGPVWARCWPCLSALQMASRALGAWSSVKLGCRGLPGDGLFGFALVSGWGSVDGDEDRDKKSEVRAHFVPGPRASLHSQICSPSVLPP